MVGVEEGREFRFRRNLYCTLKRVLSVYFLVVVWILVDVYWYDKKMSYKITFMSFREHKGRRKLSQKSMFWITWHLKKLCIPLALNDKNWPTLIFSKGSGSRVLALKRHMLFKGSSLIHQLIAGGRSIDYWVLFIDWLIVSALMLLVGWQKGIRPVKNWVVGCWHGYLSGAWCKIAYGPADAAATHCLLLQ